jgi:hypothetical protein
MQRETKTIVAMAVVCWTAGCTTAGRHVATTSAAIDAAPSPDPSSAAAAVAPSPPACGSSGAPCPPVEAVIVVDPKLSAKPISPGIYGVAFADKRSLEVATVHRFGGDCSSLYNWKNDAFNCGADWQFANQSVRGFGYPPYNDPGMPQGTSAVDYMVRTTRQAKADVLMTIPTLGWVARDGEAHGDPSGKNPGRAAVKVDPGYMRQWVEHLVSTFGGAKAGGVKYYQLDNEPDNWSKMHADVHPKAATAAELWSTWEAYASAVKAADPDAYVLAYSPATLEALVYSPMDETHIGIDQPEGSPVDGDGHIVRPITSWLLKQAAAYEKRTGKRIIDCIDLHYPTAGSNPVSDTRSLWDPSYDEHSWLTQYCYKGPIDLLPRIQQWIDASYPGTGICISEYTYYAGKDGSGGSTADPHAAVVEADALGIFGKYGVKVAAYWTLLTDSNGQPAAPYGAFAMYRNYDGKGGHFGDTSIAASSKIEDVAVYASTDSASAPTKLWVMLVNRGESTHKDLGVMVREFQPAATAEVYRSAGASAIRDVAQLTGNSVSVSLPPLSITLLVISKG